MLILSDKLFYKAFTETNLMKKIVLAALSLLMFELAFAQEVEVRYSNSSGKYGLQNIRSGYWVTPQIYDNGSRFGSYRGTYYYWMKKGAYYGVLDEKGNIASDFKWDDINGFANGFFCVKKNGSWGLADTDNHLMYACAFRTAWIDDSQAGFQYWKTSNSLRVPMNELVDARNKKIKQEKEAAEQKIKLEQEKAAHDKKEKELASFTEYAKAFVEPKVNIWQHKGEFEKLADYQKRVTGPTRTAMIDSLTRVAEKNFIAEHAALKPENGYMKLDLYDSENEVFFIESAKLGKMVVPVPISEGPDFKAHFSSLEKKNPVFYIDNDKIALASLEFFDKATLKTYRFSNNNALSYNHYDIDPDTYRFDLVNIVTAKPADDSAINTTSAPKRPIINILSPDKNTTYSDPKVTIRYQATVFDGSAPSIHAWVNGLQTDVQPKRKSASKGVVSGWEEIELLLPKDRDHQCNIMLSVTDGSGYSSENKTLSLRFIGDMPKPKLHLFAVGVSNYESPSLTKLGYASKDAKDFVSTISASDVSMYDGIVTPTILTDSDATKSNIERSLASLTRTVEQDDVVMLFFSGHGALDGEDAYFMSVDAIGGEPYTGVDFSLIRKNMTKIRDKKCRVLIFMDACYSGAMFNAKSDLKSITFAENDIIGYYSSTASQTSAEFSADENGLFTKALIEGLKGKAKNKEGEITTIGLQKYISDYVNKQTAGKQSPIVENKLGDIILYKVK